MTRGFRVGLIMEEARAMSSVSPSGLCVLPGRLRLKEVGDWTLELGSEAQNGRATRLCEATSGLEKALSGTLLLLLLALCRGGWFATVWVDHRKDFSG